LLKYLENRPVLKQFVVVSKPGRKVNVTIEIYKKLMANLSPNRLVSEFSLTIPLIFSNGCLYQPSDVSKFLKGGSLLCCIVI